MQESWSVHAAQNKHAKSFYPSNTWTFLFPITRQEFADQELSLSCPILSSVLDNQKQAVAWDTYHSGLVEPRSRGVQLQSTSWFS